MSGSLVLEYPVMFFSDRMSCRVLRCVVNVLNVHSSVEGNSDDV